LAQAKNWKEKRDNFTFSVPSTIIGETKKITWLSGTTRKTTSDTRKEN
jgi:hypothetical protein